MMPCKALHGFCAFTTLLLVPPSRLAQLASGVWIDGSVVGEPRPSQWATLPRIGLPQPIAVPADVGKGVDFAHESPMCAPRVRKKVEVNAVLPTRQLPLSVDSFSAHTAPASALQHYDASTSSTEYTRALRMKEHSSEELRRACLVVDFTDSVSRCVRLDDATKGSSWVFHRDWAAKQAKLQKTLRPPARLSPGQQILYRIDGRAWRQVTLQRQGVSPHLLVHVHARFLGEYKDQTSPSGTVRCGLGSDDAQGDAVCEGVKWRKQLMETGEFASTAVEKEADVAAHSDWWRIAYGCVELVVRLSEDTRLLHWHAPPAEQKIEGAIAAEMQADVKVPLQANAEDDSHVADVAGQSLSAVKPSRAERANLEGKACIATKSEECASVVSSALVGRKRRVSDVDGQSCNVHSSRLDAKTPNSTELRVSLRLARPPH